MIAALPPLMKINPSLFLCITVVVLAVSNLLDLHQSQKAVVNSAELQVLLDESQGQTRNALAQVKVLLDIGNQLASERDDAREKALLFYDEIQRLRKVTGEGAFEGGGFGEVPL